MPGPATALGIAAGILAHEHRPFVGAEPLYGYEIVRRLRRVPGLVISEGTIYPILSRFRREGFVTTTSQESPEGPARKYYRLTPAGRKQLAQMNHTWQLVTDGVRQIGESKP